MRLVHSSDFPPRTPANFGALLETVSASSLQAWVERIAVPRNFFAQRESNRATARWLLNELAAWGYHVQIHGPFENIVVDSWTTGYRVFPVNPREGGDKPT